MNETEIESLLRQAPRPTPPAGLRQRLLDDLPVKFHATSHTAASRPEDEGAPHWRRWLPAFSFGLLLLGCLIALGVQTSQLLELKRQNGTLRAATATLEQLREENATLQSLRAQAAAQAQAREELAELETLRAEAGAWRERARELAVLRAENQRLSAERAAAAAKAGEVAEEDPLAEARGRAERINCISNIKQLGLGARMFANDHQDQFPPDMVSMKDELNTPKILTCPSDRARKRAERWEDFDGSSLSYEYFGAGTGDRDDPQHVLFRCRIHNNIGLYDGSAQQLNDASKLFNVGGRLKTTPR